MNFTRVLAADQGGTNLRAAVVEFDQHGQSVLLPDTYTSLVTEHETDAAQVIQRGLAATVARFGSTLHGIAWDVAGPVGKHTHVLNAPNIQYLRNNLPYDLQAATVAQFGKPTIITNDLEAACAGEREKGSLKGVDWAMLENIGTGWGGARLFNGIAVAAEPGHQKFAGSEAPCGCGKPGCIEAEFGGAVMKKKIVALCAAQGITIPNDMHPCAFADAEAENGAPWATDFYTKVATDIGDIWGSNLNTCPEFTHISYMGSFLLKAMRVEAFRQTVRKAMIDRSMFPHHQDIVLAEVSAPLHENGQPLGPLYGAARIWMQNAA